MGKRRKKSLRVMMLWDRRQQQRFIEAVERLCSLVNDLDVLVSAKKRRSQAAKKANETRKITPLVAASNLLGEALGVPQQANGQLFDK